jgi:hypothetical protein
MKRFVALIAAISLAGCTTLRPIEGTSTELQQRISAGELLKAGDRVSIVTTDAKTHRFSVTGISAGLIEGKADSVPVDQVASLEKRQFSRAKTLALVAGVVLVVAGGVAIAAANAVPAFAL